LSSFEDDGVEMLAHVLLTALVAFGVALNGASTVPEMLGIALLIIGTYAFGFYRGLQQQFNSNRRMVMKDELKPLEKGELLSVSQIIDPEKHGLTTCNNCKGVGTDACTVCGGTGLLRRIQ
jgi:hypothetical protein